MIYLLSAILVGFGVWYLVHVYQKVTHKRKMREAVKERPVPMSQVYFEALDYQDERVWEITSEERHQECVNNGTYTPPSSEQLRTLDKSIEGAKNNPPIYRESFAKYADDEEDTRRCDYIATAIIADAIISTPDTSDSFSGGGGEFGGGGASGSWDSGSDTSSSYDSGSSSSYDSGGSDSGSFGGND